MSPVLGSTTALENLLTNSSDISDFAPFFSLSEKAEWASDMRPKLL